MVEEINLTVNRSMDSYTYKLPFCNINISLEGDKTDQDKINANVINVIYDTQWNPPLPDRENRNVIIDGTADQTVCYLRSIWETFSANEYAYTLITNSVDWTKGFIPVDNLSTINGHTVVLLYCKNDNSSPVYFALIKNSSINLKFLTLPSEDTGYSLFAYADYITSFEDCAYYTLSNRNSNSNSGLAIYFYKEYFQEIHENPTVTWYALNEPRVRLYPTNRLK